MHIHDLVFSDQSSVVTQSLNPMFVRQRIACAGCILRPTSLQIYRNDAFQSILFPNVQTRPYFDRSEFEPDLPIKDANLLLSSLSLCSLDEVKRKLDALGVHKGCDLDNIPPVELHYCSVLIIFIVWRKGQAQRSQHMNRRFFVCSL